MNDIESKIEQSAKNVLDAVPVSVPVFTGLSGDTKTLPSAICAAEDVSEVEGLDNTGIYRASLRVTVRSNAHDSDLTAHRERVAEVRNAIRVDDIKDRLSTLADFTCIYAGRCVAGQEVADEQSFSTDLILSIVCCPSDV